MLPGPARRPETGTSADPRRGAGWPSELLAPLGASARHAAGPLGPLTTYRVGGPRRPARDGHGEEDLALVAAAVRASGLPVLVVGRGSNLLVADAGFAGIAVMLDPTGFGAVAIDGAVVRAGGAVPLPALARQTVEAGLTGLEWAVGVPGSVGGGVRMNAGGHGSDIAHCLRSCRVVDLGADGPAPGPPAGSAVPTSGSATAPRLSARPRWWWRPTSSCARRPGPGRAHHPRHRALAAPTSTRRAERRLGVHQPAWRAAGQLGGLADRHRRLQRPAMGERHGVAQARQLHPG